jgi:hypothetical protein
MGGCCSNNRNKPEGTEFNLEDQIIARTARLGFYEVDSSRMIARIRTKTEHGLISIDNFR